MKEIWSVYNKAADFKEIAQKYGIDMVTARVMRNRDVIGEEQIARYLGQTDFKGYDPALLKDMDKGCNLMSEEMKKGGKIRIISDYDVDGLMSNYILYRGLNKVNQDKYGGTAKLDYRIPHRMRDGYGLNKKMVEELIQDEVTLLITCDNGIAAKEEIAYAKKNGITVIVTDHHEVQGQVPDADAVIDPKQEECSYPYKEICGAVVAYKFIEQLYKESEISPESMQIFDVYAAIATVCDVMKLTDENRYIVKRGLKKLNEQLKNHSVDTGLYALIRANQLEDKNITAMTFGFIIGPCLNASGRLSSAQWGLKLLLEEDNKKAEHRAERLTQMNAIRKKMSSHYEQEAYELAQKQKEDKVLVIYLRDCHESIAGIVAGRVREKTGKPTIILTASREEGIVKGSARSIPEYNIFEKLYAQKTLLTQFGGHPMAAGLSLPEDNIDLIRKRLNEECGLTDKDIAIKRHIDVIMPVSYICEELIEDFHQLEPFGNGNEKPVFAAREMTLLGGRIFGARKNVLKLNFLSSEGTHISGTYFGTEPLQILEQVEEETGQPVSDWIENNRSFGVKVNVMYYPVINEYMGKKNIELRLISLKG